jgi:hypothetical protein
MGTAYRTTSENAILMITGTPPIDLLAAERKGIYLGGDEETARDTTMAM